MEAKAKSARAAAAEAKRSQIAQLSCEIDRIVEERVRGTGLLGGPPGKPEFRIRWKGYGPDADTWEPIRHLRAQHIATFREEQAAIAAAVAASRVASVQP